MNPISIVILLQTFQHPSILFKSHWVMLGLERTLRTFVIVKSSCLEDNDDQPLNSGTLSSHPNDRYLSRSSSPSQ